jgi:hypothetical protein
MTEEGRFAQAAGADALIAWRRAIDVWKISPPEEDP